MRISRRGLQLALGVLWLLDGALQLQPFMFTRGFAQQIIAPVGMGQPAPVHWTVATAASVIGAHPAILDSFFAGVQLLIGLGLLCRRSARAALIASIGWALGVWLFGEGLGGVFGSGATLLNGAPGAAVLYALLAVVALERPGVRNAGPSRVWLPVTWAATWTGLAVLELLLGSAAEASTASTLTANAGALPEPLGAAARSLATATRGSGAAPELMIAALCLLVGLAALVPRWRVAAASGGGVLALATWVFAEGFGGIAGGQATDPNSGPLLILLALALCSFAAPAPRAALPRTARVPRLDSGTSRAA